MFRIIIAAAGALICTVGYAEDNDGTADFAKLKKSANRLFVRAVKMNETNNPPPSPIMAKYVNEPKFLYARQTGKDKAKIGARVKHEYYFNGRLNSRFTYRFVLYLKFWKGKWTVVRSDDNAGSKVYFHGIRVTYGQLIDQFPDGPES